MVNNGNTLRWSAGWVEDFVLHYKLCPFAHQPVSKGLVRWVLFTGDDLRALADVFLAECALLGELSPAETETTLIVLESALQDFEDYLDYTAFLEEMLEAAGYEDLVQLATFHPAYRFEGEAAGDPSQYTNRSPFPMIHLLRVEQVARAVDSFPDIEGVPQRNIRVLREEGAGALDERLRMIEKRYGI